MRSITLPTILYLATTLPAGEVMDLPNRNSPYQVGMGGVSYYNPEFPFLDLMMQSRDDWNVLPTGSTVTYRADGYPAGLPSGVYVEKPVVLDVPAMPTGRYAVLWQGTGSIRPGLATVTVSAKTSNREEWDIAAGNKKLMVRIATSDPADPVRDLHIVPIEHEATFRERPFRPEVIHDNRHMRTIRFMDWLATNQGNDERAAAWRSWSRRTLLDSHSQTSDDGCAYELPPMLCNEVMADLWLNVPHNADDDFVRQLARLTRDRLDPRLRILVEYSNETWNFAGGFAGQYNWCGNRALEMTGGTYNRHNYYAKRSLEIWRIFEEEVGERRIVRVMAAQGANPWTFEQRLDVQVPVSYQTAKVLPRTRTDAVSPTSYMAGFSGSGVITDGTLKGGTVQGWIDQANAFLLNPRWGDQFSGTGSGDGLLAVANGLPIIAYEGGLGWELNASSKKTAIYNLSTTDDDAATYQLWIDNMVAAAGDSRMYEWQKSAIDVWFGLDAATGDDDVYMVSQFVSASGWSKYGVWGAHNRFEPLGNPSRMANRHRLRAIQDWIEANRLPNQAPVVAAGADANGTPGTAVALAGGFSDDGYRQMGRVHAAWTVSAAPAGAVVSFADPYSASTSVTCSQPGSYVLRLSANDGWAIGYDELTITIGGGSGNAPPTIGAVSDRAITEDAATGAIAVTIGDAETAATALTLTATSSNTTLVPVGGIVLGGSGGNRTVSIAPAANQSGSATITLTVTDGAGASASETFVLAVTAVNDPPASTAPPAITGTATQGQILTGTNGTWSDVEGHGIAYARQWQRADSAGGANLVDIAGATGATYTLTAGDVGKVIRLKVTATDNDTPTAASTIAYSTYTAVVSAIPTTATPVIGSASGTGTATPSLSGTATGLATVRIYDGGTLIGTVSVDAAGAWSWTASPPLPAGVHSLTVTAMASGLAESLPSATVTVSVPGPGGGVQIGGDGGGGGGGGCGLGGAVGLVATGLAVLGLRRRRR